MVLRKAQAERDATSKKKSAKIENLQKSNNELQKKINEINTSRENEQALNAAVMNLQEEKLVAKMKVEQEDHTANVKIMEGKHEELTIKAEELEKNLQRKYEEIEVLQLIIEEKENMDTTKAEEVDSEHLNAVSDDKGKPVGQEDFLQQFTKETAPSASEQKVSELEAKEAEMSKTQSGNECRNKDKHRRERWYPQGVRQKKPSPEEMEIMLNYCLTSKEKKKNSSDDDSSDEG